MARLDGYVFNFDLDLSIQSKWMGEYWRNEFGTGHPLETDIDKAALQKLLADAKEMLKKEGGALALMELYANGPLRAGQWECTLTWRRAPPTPPTPRAA